MKTFTASVHNKTAIASLSETFWLMFSTQRLNCDQEKPEPKHTVVFLCHCGEVRLLLVAVVGTHWALFIFK